MVLRSAIDYPDLSLSTNKKYLSFKKQSLQTFLLFFSIKGQFQDFGLIFLALMRLYSLVVVDVLPIFFVLNAKISL